MRLLIGRIVGCFSVAMTGGEGKGRERGRTRRQGGENQIREKRVLWCVRLFSLSFFPALLLLSLDRQGDFEEEGSSPFPSCFPRETENKKRALAFLLPLSLSLIFWLAWWLEREKELSE